MAGVRQVTGSREPAATRRPGPLLREALGRVLREARQDRDERLVDVARQASISPQYLSEVERGAKEPSSEVLRSVSGALGLHPAEVVRRASSVMVGRSHRTVEVLPAEHRSPASTPAMSARRGRLQVLAGQPLPVRAPRATAGRPAQPEVRLAA